MKKAIVWVLMAVAAAPVFATCISGVAPNHPYSEFTFTNDELSHSDSGLTWKRCLHGETFDDNGTPSIYTDDNCVGNALTMDWPSALQVADAASGWRLPNVKELSSLVELRCYDPAINTAIFPGHGAVDVWSDSPLMLDNTHSWGVDFDSGQRTVIYRGDVAVVRLVAE